MPTLETVSEVCPVNLRTVDLQHSSEVCLKDTSQMFETVLHLLLLLLSPSPARVTQSRRGSLNYCDLPWTIDCLVTLSSIMSFDGAHIVASQSHARRCVLYLRVLRKCLAVAISIKSETVSSYKAASLLSRTIGVLLRLASKNMDPLVSDALCWCISDLLFIGHSSQVVSDSFSEHLVPKFLEALSTRTQFEGYVTDLQVM